MATTQTQLFDPPAQSMAVDKNGRLASPLFQWLSSVQRLLPLVAVDTTSGNVVIALPPAGLNSTTGESNQNQEISYVKTSADVHTVTISGAVGGNQVLTAQTPSAGSAVRFKSDGTNWYKISAV